MSGTGLSSMSGDQLLSRSLTPQANETVPHWMDSDGLRNRLNQDE